MARIPAFQAGRVGSIPITRSKKEVVPLGMTSFLFYIDGNRTRSNNKQSGGLFVRRGNERSEAIGAGSAETNSHHPLQKEVVPFGTASFFIWMGIEQGVKKTVRGTVFSWGNEH